MSNDITIPVAIDIYLSNAIEEECRFLKMKRSEFARMCIEHFIIKHGKSPACYDYLMDYDLEDYGEKDE